MYICASCEASLTQLSSIQLSGVKRELSSVPGVQCTSKYQYECMQLDKRRTMNKYLVCCSFEKQLVSSILRLHGISIKFEYHAEFEFIF
jgi:hypothetical protein